MCFVICLLPLHFIQVFPLFLEDLLTTIFLCFDFQC
uniref:Uncharacterized protein n=1 Tax=Rhizophora mucronata TaxID=61149 RepID=A0A2P2MAB8_RHIMU